MPFGRVLVVAIFTTATVHAATHDYAFSLFAGAPPSISGAVALDHPYDVAADSSGNLYIADTQKFVIRKLSADRRLTILAGDAGKQGYDDGAGAAARFTFVTSIVVDAAGTVYAADSGAHTIRRITPAGEVRTIAGAPGVAGNADGPGTAARFNFPTGLALDRNGDLWIADSSNFTIRKMDQNGVVTTVAGRAGNQGETDGKAAVARFSNVYGLAFDSAGNLFVADAGNNNIRKMTPAGDVTTFAGTGDPGSLNGTAKKAQLNRPRDIAIDGANVLYVSEFANHTIRRITPAGDVTTFAGLAGTAGATNGAGSTARFNEPWGLAIDLLGNIYVADTSNNDVRTITPQALVTSLATAAVPTGSVDGSGANARFNSPVGVAIDRLGNIFIADRNNNAIRKATPAGEVSTFAGARFNAPSDLAFDSMGNLFVCEIGNAIRKITPAGTVSTYAGNGAPGSSDGNGTAARFLNPAGIAVDAVGNVYVADTGNHAIRMISLSGDVTTIAGAAGQAGSADGAGSDARFNQPQDVAVDAVGNLYVTDSGNRTIRKISPSGEVTTYAGATGVTGTSDGDLATARFVSPRFITIDGAGNVFVTQSTSVRQITPAGQVYTIAGSRTTSGYVDGVGGAARFGAASGIGVDAAGRLFVADTTNHALRLGVSTAPQPRRRAVRP